MIVHEINHLVDARLVLRKAGPGREILVAEGGLLCPAR
jgi:hypothetical protein